MPEHSGGLSSNSLCITLCIGENRKSSETPDRTLEKSYGAMEKELSILTTYLINQIHERGGRPIKTQLIKLLYLLDLEFYRRHSRTVTQLPWRYYHHGPYAVEVDKILGTLPDIDESEFVSWAGRKGYTYVSDSDVDENEHQLVDMFGYPVKHALDRILDRWALEDLWILLDYVYFETEPMQGAHRGDILDFSKVLQEEVTVPRVLKVDLPESKLKELRQKLVDSRPKRKGMRTPTPALYDSTYFDALHIMDEVDLRATYIPRGYPVQGPQE